MEIGNIFFAIVVVFIIGALLWHSMFASNKERAERINSLAESIPDFNVSRTISDYENRYRILIDDVSRKVCFIIDNTKNIVEFDKIISVEYIQNGKTISSKSTVRTIGGALVGGAIAGGVGAIIGGLSGDSELSTKISSISVKVLIRDISLPTINIETFNCKWTVERKPVNPTDAQCKWGIDIGKQIVDVLSVIIDDADHNSSSTNRVGNSPQNKQYVGSVADEIKILANLRDEGILTQEEFDKQKASLLA